jgi:outer membrane receptor protein involved in Fe transport
MADFTYKSKYFSGPDNNPLFPTEYDGIVNASIAYTFPNQHWELQLSGKNLTNNRVPLTTNELGVFVLPVDDFFAGGMGRVVLLIPPRTWAATLRFMW